MFYEFSDDMVSVAPQDIGGNFLAAGFISAADAEKAEKLFNIPRELAVLCKKEKNHSCAEVAQGCIYGVLDITKQTDGGSVFGFFVSKNLVLIVSVRDCGCALRDNFLSAIRRFDPSDISQRQLCFALFDKILRSDGDFLESVRENIDALEGRLNSGFQTDNINFPLLQIKKQLLFMRNYYDCIEDIALALCDEDTFGAADIRYPRTLLSRIERLKERVDILSENTVHLREAYESVLELRLNRTMKIFTLFTVIFSPLSFIAGWYGMNFDFMPELHWKYGYAGAILLFAAVAAALIMIFKRKKWI